jgi:hypothetical protein
MPFKGLPRLFLVVLVVVVVGSRQFKVTQIANVPQ